jgi:membrane-bound lytic murein transglycosylase D
VTAPVDELVALNPSLLRLITPPDTSFDLHLPAGTAALFTQHIAEIPEAKRNSWRYHRVVAGDTLASVAREYRVAQTELVAANQLGEIESIEGVEALVVPVPPVSTPSARMLLYTSRKGDTLVTIADRFGVSLSQLRRWNKITGTKVEPGRKLHVAAPVVVTRTPRSHRKGASNGVAKTHDASPAKGSIAKQTTPATEESNVSKTTRKPHARSSKSAAGAEKSGSSTARRRRTQKPATRTQ